MDDIQRLRDRLAALEDEKKVQQEELGDLHVKIEELESENTGLDALVENLMAEAEDLDNQVAGLDHELDILRERADAEVDNFQDEIVRLEHDFKSQSQVEERGSDEERIYLASKQHRHFHRPNCKWAAYILDNLLIEFSSHAEAVEALYRPCKTCRA